MTKKQEKFIGKKPASMFPYRLAQSGHEWYAKSLILGQAEGFMDHNQLMVRLSDLMDDWGVEFTLDELSEYIRLNADDPKSAGM